jgi:hypothetical protein
MVRRCMMRRDDMPVRSYQLDCTSGDTSGLIVPANAIAHLTELEIDTSDISGNIGIATVQVRDTYTPTGGTATTKVRKRVSFECGEVISVDLRNADIQLLDNIKVRTNISGPIVGVGVAFE